MKTLENLHLLVRLLKEFELPISPILEFAIKEKENQICSESSLAVAKKEIETTPCNRISKVVDASCQKNSSGGKYAKLRVYRDDNSIIQDHKVANTFAQTIKEIGPKKVQDLDISSDGMNLVTKGGNPLYPGAQKDVGEGLYVNTHSGTVWKRQTLERIFAALHLSWKVKIVYED